MSLDDKTIYVFVRQDLPLAQQLVQSQHAVFQMAQLYFLEPKAIGLWGIPRVINIGMPGKKGLRRVVDKLVEAKLRYHAYAEPDRVAGVDGSWTAVATYPLTSAECEVLKNYRLWNPASNTYQKDTPCSSGCPVTT